MYGDHHHEEANKVLHKIFGGFKIKTHPRVSLYFVEEIGNYAFFFFAAFFGAFFLAAFFFAAMVLVKVRAYKYVCFDLKASK